VPEVRVEECMANTAHFLDAFFSVPDTHTVRLLPATVLAVSKIAPRRKVSRPKQRT
jgi:hypothetical protein